MENYVFLVQRLIDIDHYDVIAITSTLEKAKEAVEAYVNRTFASNKKMIFEQSEAHPNCWFGKEEGEEFSDYCIAKTLVDNEWFFLRRTD